MYLKIQKWFWWSIGQIPKSREHYLRQDSLCFAISNNGYTKAEVVAEYPHDINQKNTFPPGSKEGFLGFRQLAGPPPSIDVANIYPPEQEQGTIINNVLLTLGAKYIWLQPPVTSAQTRDLARKHGLTFIEGHDIAQIAQEL